MKVTVTLDVDGKKIKDSRDVALALVAAAANIDHGATLDNGYAEYSSINLHGLKVGEIHYEPDRLPVIQPHIRPTRVITAGELKPDSTIIEAGRAFKVGNVRHTEDGYTYYSMRSLTGEPYQNDNACMLSIAGITVEAR